LLRFRAPNSGVGCWFADDRRDPEKLKEVILDQMRRHGVRRIGEVAAAVKEDYGEVPVADFNDVLISIVAHESLLVYEGEPEQTDKPDELITGPTARMHIPSETETLITRALASERNWLGNGGGHGIELSGREADDRLRPLLRRLGGFFNRGATSTIDALDMADLRLPEGGTLRIQIADAPPGSMRALGELFEVVDALTAGGEGADFFLRIDHPDEDCVLVAELVGERGCDND